MIIPELSNAFITSIISSMEDILRKHDYAVIVCDCRNNAKREKEAVEFLMHRRVDGLINMATDATGAHLKMPLAAGIPVLLIDRLIIQTVPGMNRVLWDISEKPVATIEFE